jgi:Transposase DNA-binding/Transposase Tn5 dimerisation domain
MLPEWVMDEMKTVKLPDKRLDQRLQEVLAQLAARPTASIPAACGGRAEMEAAYRLFDNERVSFEAILESHQEATRRRMGQQPAVVLVQDTTAIDLTRPTTEVLGAGRIQGTQRGALLHVLHAFTRDGTPLGTLAASPWVRADEPPRRQVLTHAQRLATPLAEKESARWIETLQRAQGEAQQQPQTHFICVADSEADIYEFFAQGMSQPRTLDWVVRACQNRSLQEGADETACLLPELVAQPVLFTKTIHVRARPTNKVTCSKRRREQPRVSRTSEVEVRARQVTLRPPRRPDQKLPIVTVNAVLVREINPPSGEEPVEWLLLTSLPIGAIEEVRQVIEVYCIRWMVEVFFRTLKSGCRVEERRFEQVDRQLRCLAVYLIVAWRTLYVCRLGRSCPDISSEAIFEAAEWKAVYRVVKNQQPPKQPPTLVDMVRMVAQLGGYVNRRRPDPPGPQTVWLGMQRMYDLATCWKLFGPETRP